MDAKEFFEKNKCEYFDYKGEKVRVVGYDIQHVIISTKKGGWEFGTIHNIDRLLLHDDDKCLYVNIKDLNPIATQNIDLCELLEGCEGIELWSDIFGRCKLLNTKGNCSYKIEVQVIDKDDDEDGFECFTTDGKFYTGYPNAKCMLWPSETNRDWSTFKKPIKIKEGDPVMCFNGINNHWTLFKYNGGIKTYYKYVVLATEFDFTDFNSNKSKSII